MKMSDLIVYPSEDDIGAESAAIEWFSRKVEILKKRRKWLCENGCVVALQCKMSEQNLCNNTPNNSVAMEIASDELEELKRQHETYSNQILRVCRELCQFEQECNDRPLKQIDGFCVAAIGYTRSINEAGRPVYARIEPKTVEETIDEFNRR